MTSELAKKIAAALFVNGNGDRAQRLVLIGDDEKNLGGWSESSVAAQVQKILNADQNEAYDGR